MKAFFTMLAVLAVALVASPALAQDAAAVAGNADGMIALAAGLAIAIAAFGGAMSQAKAAAAALEGIARNPNAAGKIQTPMIIALVLIESLVIYALVIAFLLQGKF